MEGWEISLIILGSVVYFLLGVFASPVVMNKLNMPLSVNITLFFFFPPLWLAFLFVAVYLRKPKEPKIEQGVVPGKKYSISYKKNKENGSVKMKKSKKKEKI